MSDPLACSQFTTRPWSFAQDIAAYARHGFTHIEICEEKLDPDKLDEQFAALTDAGLTVCAVQPLVRTFLGSRMQAAPRDASERFDRLVASIERLAPHVRGVPFITNTGAPVDGDIQGCLDHVAHSLERLGPIAEELGVFVALEPLNPTILNIESGIWTVDQALDLIDAAGNERIGLCLDSWNVWQQPGLETAIARAGNRIFSVQLSDWRTPRSLADRLVPGDGDIPLETIVDAARKAGFAGPLTVEIFSDKVPDALWHGDLDDVLQRSVSALTSLGRSAA